MRKYLTASLENLSPNPLIGRRVFAALATIYILWALFGWSKLFDQVDGPLAVPGELRGFALLPGRYSICMDRPAAQEISAFDRSKLILEVMQAGKSITIQDLPKPGKYGDWFPFERPRSGPDGVHLIEMPIGSFVIASPGNYTLTARNVEAQSAAKPSLTVTRAPDWLSVIVSPGAPFFALLLLLFLSVPIGCMFAVVRFQPSAPWLRMGWNGVLCLLSTVLLLIGTFCIPASLILMMTGDSRFPAEFLWFDMGALGIAPTLCGAFLMKTQLQRLQSEQKAPFGLRLLLGVLGVMAAMTGAYFAVVCVVDIFLRLRGAHAIWGAPPDIVSGIFAASVTSVVLGCLLAKCQLRSGRH